MRKQELWLIPFSSILRQTVFRLTPRLNSAGGGRRTQSLACFSSKSENCGGLFPRRHGFDFLGDSWLFGKCSLSTQSAEKFDAKCWNCNDVAGSAPFLVCRSCRCIQPVDQSVDYFQIFGLDKKFDIEDGKLELKYKEWQKKLHPDSIHSKTKRERAYAAEQSARATEAFQTLNNPLSRAVYILKLEGPTVDEEETISKQDLPSELMEVREAVEEAADSQSLNQIQSQESGHSATTSTHTDLMLHLFRENQYKKGCKLYNEMMEGGPKPDSVTITEMLAGLIHHNQISDAWNVFKSIEANGTRLTRKSYSIFIKELCKISQTDEILKVLDDMQASKIESGDGVFNLVISLMKERGEVNKVEKVKQMQRTYRISPQEDKVSSDDVIKGQEINTDLIHQPEPVTKDHDKVEPLSEAYNEQNLHEVCIVLSSSQDWCVIQDALEDCTIQFTPALVVEALRNSYMNGYAALQFFSWVSKRTGYSHTTETYNMAIKLAGCGKDFKHMRSLFYEMRRKGYSITPDTWTIMIMLYGRTGLTEIALKIFDEMKADNCKPTDSTYKYLIMSLCGKKGRKVDEAMKIFQKMLHAGHIPDRELVETYLVCLCEVGKLLEARKYTDLLCKVGYTIPLGYSLNIRALCRAGRIDEALKMADEVGAERTKLDQYTYGSIVHALLQKGRTEEALARVDFMKQEGINPTVHVYTSFIVHFLKEKKLERALETLREMQREGCEPTVVTYSALIRGFMNVGKVADAWNVFYFMKLKGPSPDFKTYSMFITCLCKVGKSEEALQLLYEMVKSGIVPSNVNFRTVFYGLNREGKKDLAHTVRQRRSDLIRNRKSIT